MNAPQGAAQHQQVIEVVEFRRVAAAAREQGEAKTVVFVQRDATGTGDGGDHRHVRRPRATVLPRD